MRINMKNIYWVFAGDNKYEPRGGMKDYQNQFETENEAKAWINGYLASNCVGWAHIYDFETSEIIYEA